MCEALQITGDEFLESYREEFEKQGFVLIKDFFTENGSHDVIRFSNEIEQWDEQAYKWMIYYESNAKTNTETNTETKNNTKVKARLENFLKYHPELNEFYKKKVVPTVEYIYGNKVNLFKEKMNWKNGRGKGFKPHQDHPAWIDFPSNRFVSTALFANKTTVDNGCLEFGKNNEKFRIHHTLDNNKDTTGEICPAIVNNLIWSAVTTTPRDLLIFDSYAPHRSGTNNTDDARRIFYFTFNSQDDGDFYDEYLLKKRREFPPEIERNGQEVNTEGNKYNIANPIN